MGKPLELPITFWSFATLMVTHMPLREAISSASLPMCHELQLLDLSNTAWAFAQSSMVDEPFITAIASQAIRLLREASPQTALGNPLALVWALWNRSQQRWEQSLFEQVKALGL